MIEIRLVFNKGFVWTALHFCNNDRCSKAMATLVGLSHRSPVSREASIAPLPIQPTPGHLVKQQNYPGAVLQDSLYSEELPPGFAQHSSRPGVHATSKKEEARVGPKVRVYNRINPRRQRLGDKIDDVIVGLVGEDYNPKPDFEQDNMYAHALPLNYVPQDYSHLTYYHPNQYQSFGHPYMPHSDLPPGFHNPQFQPQHQHFHTYPGQGELPPGFLGQQDHPPLPILPTGQPEQGQPLPIMTRKRSLHREDIQAPPFISATYNQQPRKVRLYGKIKQGKPTFLQEMGMVDYTEHVEEHLQPQLIPQPPLISSTDDHVAPGQKQDAAEEGDTDPFGNQKEHEYIDEVMIEERPSGPDRLFDKSDSASAHHSAKAQTAKRSFVVRSSKQDPASRNSSARIPSSIQSSVKPGFDYDKLYRKYNMIYTQIEIEEMNRLGYLSEFSQSAVPVSEPPHLNHVDQEDSQSKPQYQPSRQASGKETQKQQSMYSESRPKGQSSTQGRILKPLSSKSGSQQAQLGNF